MWAGCSRECGGGTTFRFRNCLNGEIGEGDFTGTDRQNMTCNNEVKKIKVNDDSVNAL